MHLRPPKADIAINTVKTKNIFQKISSVVLTIILYFYCPVLLMGGMRRQLSGQEHYCASKRTWVWIPRAHKKAEHLHMPGMLVLGQQTSGFQGLTGQSASVKCQVPGSVRNSKLRTLTDSSAVKSTGCSVRRPRFDSQHPLRGSQLSVTPFALDPTPSSSLRGHQTRTRHTGMRVCKNLHITKKMIQK